MDPNVRVDLNATSTKPSDNTTSTSSPHHPPRYPGDIAVRAGLLDGILSTGYTTLTMFASLKSFTSNIQANYQLAPHPAAYSGPWKIYDAKKKSTGQTVSVFSFEKKALDNQSSSSLSLRSTSTAGLKQVQEEAYERLKKAASSLARLRHPCVLELVEQVEENRGGMMFATEHVTGSLGGLLKEKDEQENRGGGRGNVVDDGRGGRRRREVEIDELEIQKGVLQIAKGLEFLHESAGLIHGNLTPDAIFINAKVCSVPERLIMALTRTG